MEYRKLVQSILVFFVFLVVAGCSYRGGSSSLELENFNYGFSMESANNYKVDFFMSSDSTYSIEQQDLFFDRYAGTDNKETKDGLLTPDEFDKFKRLIGDSGIYDLEDSYGFDESSDNTIVYMIELTENNNTKHVVINSEADYSFKREFYELIEYTTKIINEKLSD